MVAVPINYDFATYHCCATEQPIDNHSTDRDENAEGTSRAGA
jgi:hypothetical protein